ncbi:MAG: OmpA family protein [Bacteroidales bacterium]|nr:OmpA family protein [Bacteroidales bacterium]
MNNVKSVFILLLLAFSQNIYGQEINVQLKQDNSDCTGAILVTDSIFGPVSAPAGPGKKMEIRGSRTSPYSFHKEHHTVWYKFISPGKGELELTIIPLSSDDDYDFLLFRKTGHNICSKIQNNDLKPIRSNISRNNKNINSITGLRESAAQKYVNQGPGDDFSQSVKTEKEDTFLLVVDNVYRGGKGHTLKLHFSAIEKEPEKPVVEKKGPETTLMITIKDKSTGKLLNADIHLSSPTSKKPVIKKSNISQVIKKINSREEYQLTVNNKMYFRAITSFNTPGHDTTIHLNIELTKIEKGNKLKLKNLYFYSNSASFRRTSYATLRNLLSIMEEHPGLKIAIHGHVNQPYQWKDKNSDDYIQRLSKKRADAVKRYLSRRGISSDRMITEGFSNREMIYPYAETEAEMKANRRVEIIVLDYKTGNQ